jgi:hypothetical protein
MPLLTNWRFMTPDEVVSVMAGGDDFNREFEGICAYRLETSVVKKIDPAWWDGFARPRIEAVEASHKAAENNGTITNEAAYVLWQEQSLEALPSGAFVWKDEFERPYYRKYAWGNIILLDARTEDAHQKSVTLKFDPFIPEPARQSMVMEGFENVMIDNLNNGQLKNSTEPQESPKERRKRWLKLYGDGERGAVRRVYEAELLQNPNADRSHIGKEIQKAIKEKKEAAEDKAMYGQLVRDGKRTGEVTR